MKVNSDSIKSYKNYFDNEKNYFNNTSYYTLNNSYLASCSDSTVQSMYSNLDSLYSKINSLYESIDSYWANFISDFDTLENSIEQLNNECTNPLVSSFISSFINTLSDEDTSATDYNNEETAAFYIKKALFSITNFFGFNENDYESMKNRIDYITMDDVERYENRTLGLLSYFDTDDYNSYKHLFAVYLTLVEDKYGIDLSDEDLEFYVQELFIADAQNNFEIAKSTPLVIEDTETEMITQIKTIGEKGYMDYTYEGDVAYYFNPYGMEVAVPLGTIGPDEDGNMTSTDMTDDQKEEYIKVVTKYYNGIMAETEKYSSEYKKKTVENTDKLVLVYIDKSNDEEEYFDWAGITHEHNFGKKSDVNIRMDCFYDLDTNTVNDDIYKYTIGAYNHEFGHVYNNSTRDSEGTFNYKDTWKDIYKQVEKNDSDYTYIREYGHSNEGEFFAETMGEYYNTDNTATSQYNPTDLKMIEIDVTVNGTHYTNLYEYIDKEIAN